METAERPRAMARLDECAEGDGRTLGENLARLGFLRIDVARVAQIVRDHAGAMSPQRLSTILHSSVISPPTFEKIAKALGVPVEELTRPPAKSPSPARPKRPRK